MGDRATTDSLKGIAGMGFLLFIGDANDIASQVILDIGNQMPKSSVEVHFAMDGFISDKMAAGLA